jgi:hypothetical protein
MGECDEDPTQEQDDLLKDGHGGGGGGGRPGDVFIKTATGIKRLLPSIFNLKVVSDQETAYHNHAKQLTYLCTGF